MPGPWLLDRFSETGLQVRHCKGVAPHEANVQDVLDENTWRPFEGGCGYTEEPNLGCTVKKIIAEKVRYSKKTWILKWLSCR